VANAVLSVTFMLPLVRLWGITGEAAGYALALWAIFLPGSKIFHIKRREYRHLANGLNEAWS
jgi:hypothetical protein